MKGIKFFRNLFELTENSDLGTKTAEQIKAGIVLTSLDTEVF